MSIFILLTVFAGVVLSAPTSSSTSTSPSDASSIPIPGQSTVYSTYNGTTPPYPGQQVGATLNTTSGPPGADDLLFQNLLSAEWVIYNFYQQGVEKFNQSAFTEAGFPNTTYEYLTQIRDNEAGHLAIFMDQISSNSIKPGSCKYEYPFTDPTSYLVLQTVIEVASMAFLTGLELQAKLQISKSALVAIATVESRHNTWSLIDNWAANPFAGPSDTIYPYANQILDFTNEWIIPGSCPSENPLYPYPNQHLPPVEEGTNTTGVTPGSQLQFNFTDPTNQPQFEEGREYYAVFCHSVFNISVPFDVKTQTVTIPAEIEQTGIIIAIVADVPGAPLMEDVLTMPLILPQSPPQLRSG